MHCSKLVQQAIGKDAAELETLLTSGDEAARRAATKEIIDRYAPLEAVDEEPLLVEEFEPNEVSDSVLVEE